MNSDPNSNYPDLGNIYPDIKKIKLDIEEIKNDTGEIITNQINMMPNSPAFEMTNRQSINQIDWKKPVTVKVSKWSPFLSKSKYLLAGVCGASLFFTGPVLIVGGTIVLSAVGSYSCYKLEQKLDSNVEKENDELLRKRLDAKKEIEKGDTGYGYIRNIKKYSTDIVTDDEFNTIFEIDIKKLYYPDFIKRHWYDCFAVLNDANKKLLRESFISYATREFGLLKVMEHKKELDFFAINDDIYYVVIENEIDKLNNGTLTFKQFLDRNGLHFQKWIMNLEHLSGLQKRMENYVVDLDIGYLEIKNQYNEYIPSIDDIQFKFLCFEKDFIKCQNNTMSYVTLKRRNGFVLISDVSHSYPYYKEIIKSEFAKLPYIELTSPDNEEDRRLFSIGIKERKDILQSRWCPLTIQQIINEDKNFFYCIGNEFTPDEWRAKTLNDTKDMRVIEIAKYYPGLFIHKILTRDSRIDEQTIGQRIDSEVLEIKSFTAFDAMVSPVLLEENIIDKVLLEPMIIQFITENFDSFMNEKPWCTINMINKYNLIPDSISDAYKNAKQDANNLINKYKTSVAFINSQNRNDLEEKKRSEIKLLKQNLDILTRTLDEKKNVRESLRLRLRTLNENIKHYESEYNGCRTKIHETMTNMERLQKMDTLNSYDFVYDKLNESKKKLETVQHEIDNDKELLSIQREINKYQKEKEKYSGYKSLIKNISSLKKEIEILKAEIEKLTIKINSTDFIKRKEQLTKDLDTSHVAGAIGVVNSIKENCFTSKPKELSEMEKEESLLRKKKEELNKKEIELKNSSEMISDSSNIDQKLSECETKLEQYQDKLSNRRFELKNTLSIDRLTDSVNKLEKEKELKEKIRKYKSEIKDLEGKIECSKMTLEQLRTEILTEKYKYEDISRICEKLEQEHLFASRETKNRQIEIEHLYEKQINTFEFDKKMKLTELEQQLQQGMDAIFDDFKTTLAM